MYLPRGLPTSLVALLCRAPLVVVPVIVGVVLGLNYLSQQCCLPEAMISCLPEAMISFAFDDGYLSVVEKAFPILEKYGYKGTVFVITSLLGQEGRLSKENLLVLAENGWEIASHGITHRSLLGFSESELQEELLGSKEALEKLGLKVYGFAPPYGEYNERTTQVVAQFYCYQRLAFPADLNDLPLREEKDRYYLRVVEIKRATTLPEAKLWILKAKREKKWLILLFHQIDGQGDYSWPSNHLEELAKFAKEEGFVGVSLSSLFK